MSRYSSHTSVDEKEALLLKLGANDEAVGDRFVLHSYDFAIVEALRRCTVVSHLKVLATSNLLHDRGRDDDEMHLYTYLSTGNALRIVTFADEGEDDDEVAIPMAPTLTASLLRAVWINPNVTVLKVTVPLHGLGDLLRNSSSSIEDLKVYLHEFENGIDNDFFAQSFGVNTTLRSLTLCSGEHHDNVTLIQRVLDSLATGTQLERLTVDGDDDVAPSLDALLVSSATPRLRHLHLRFATFTDQSAVSFCASLRSSQSLRELFLVNCTFPDANSLVESFARPDNNNNNNGRSSIVHISINGGTFGAATPCELVAALFLAPTSTLSAVGLWHDDNGYGGLFEALSGASIVPVSTDASGIVGYRSLAIRIHNRAELNQLLQCIPGFGKLRSLMVSLDRSVPLPSARFVRAIHQNGSITKLDTSVADECWERPVTANSSTTEGMMIQALLERNENLASLLNTLTDALFHNGNPIVPENVIRLRPPLLVAALPAGQGPAAGFVPQNVLRGLLTLPQEL